MKLKSLLNSAYKRSDCKLLVQSSACVLQHQLACAERRAGGSGGPVRQREELARERCARRDESTARPRARLGMRIQSVNAHTARENPRRPFAASYDLILIHSSTRKLLYS